MPGGQIIATAGAVAVFIFMYQKGKERLQGYSNASGTDPKWKDPIVAQRRAQDIYRGESYPKCQIWNDTYQVFMDTGDAAADSSQDACFERYSDRQNARYTYGPGAGQTTYRRGTGIDEPATENGTCWKSDGAGGYETFPKTEHDYLPVPDWSKRLCFTAGETLETTGHHFVDQSGTRYYQPALSLNTTNDAMPTPRCERYYFTGGLQAWQWQYTKDIPQTSMNDCLAPGPWESQEPRRWVESAPWNPSAGTYLFRNPMTQKIMEIQTQVW